ncbi:MAG: dTDP-4-amino-4,6-dideoxygalactose transaminase [Bacteroidetes bacterium]|nr:MAG: dTDP-4-amino-4,6-dideoxygalactose transaminase [Bacteroidota bacterium]
MKIPFNKPYLSGKEIENVTSAALWGHISGNGVYTQKCHGFFEEKYGFRKCFLTTSCTDAFEMAVMLMDLQKGDEVIMPSFTFVSTANPFLLTGAKIVFADSMLSHPNIDLDKVEELITEKTRVLVVMHYGGVAVDMDKALELAKKHNLILLEDVAHAIDSFYKEKPLGSFGDFAAFSFHETKNISAGEGGLLAINNKKYIERADIIWEKGTNRAAFSRGEVNKYEWVDIGASFPPSDIIAAVLFAQLESIEDIQRKRVSIWERYYSALKHLEDKGLVKLPRLPEYATNNGHLFYLQTDDQEQRDEMLDFLNNNEVHAVFHFIPLHSSPFYAAKHDGRELANADRFSNTILRLPFFYELPLEVVDIICEQVEKFYFS